MLPKLYDEFLTRSQGYGKTYLGTVNCCTKCKATEARNGAYTLELETTVNDDCANLLISQRIIEVKPNPFDPAQFFEIQNTVRKPNGRITCKAKHIKSLLFGICSEGVSASEESTLYTKTGTPAELWSTLHDDYIATPHPFIFSTDISSHGTMSLGFNLPETLGNILGGKEGSFTDTFGGEFHWNNYVISFLRSRGRKINYQLRYGQNISDAEQTESCETTYTHVLPYGKVNSSGGGKFTISALPYIIANSQAQRTKVYMLDCSEFLEQFVLNTGQDGNIEQICAAMTTYAQSYATINALGKLKAGIRVTARAELDEMAQIGLCDTVEVVLDNFGTTTTAKITQVTYDCLLERWDKIVVGEPKITVADMILNRRKYAR